MTTSTTSGSTPVGTMTKADALGGRTLPAAWFGDVTGSLTSALCLVHCLALPLLVPAGAMLAHHPLMDLGFVVLAGVAAWMASREGAVGMKVLLWSCWSLFAASIWLEHDHPALSTVGVFASLGLVGGHVVNLWNRRRTKACRCDDAQDACGVAQGA